MADTKQSEIPEIKLISDAEIKSFEADYLEFDKYSNILCGIAKGTTGPFTVGVYGDWGSGKTSVLRLTETKLKGISQQTGIIPVWFNAWQYENEEHIVFPLLSTILDSLKDVGISTPKGKTSIQDSLRSILYGISFDLGGFKISPDKMLEQEQKFKDIYLETLLKKHGEYKTAFENLEVPEGKKIVLIIDDLDRCSPIKALRILEAIKLVLNQPGFLFFIGVSDKILEDYLKHIYVDEYKVDEKKLEELNYLDKIIQLPFMVASHEKKMKNFMKKTIEDNPTLKSINGFAELSKIIVKATESNPRRIKRILNNIIMDKYLVDQFIPVLENPPKFEFIVVWRIIQHIFPKYYSVLNKEQYIKLLKGFLSKDSGTLSKSLNEEEQKIIKLYQNDKFQIFLESKLVQEWLQNDIERNKACLLYAEQLGGETDEEKRLIGEIKNRPQDGYPYEEYAEYLSKKGKIDKADEAWKQAVKLSPESGRTLEGYAIFLKNIKKDYTEAEKYYKKALELDPNDATWNGNYAIFLKNIKKDYEEAEKYYKKALELDPDHANNNGNYASFLFCQKRDEEAEKYWELSFQYLDLTSQNDLLLELQFYHFTHSQCQTVRDEAESEIKRLLDEGVTSEGWDLSGNIERAILDNQPDIDALIDYATKISVNIDYEHLRPKK